MNQTSTDRSRKLLALLLAAGLAASAAGCGQQAQPAMAEEQKDIFVETRAPETGELSLTTDFIGTVEPDELVSVFPKVAGTVLETYFNVGEPVKKGDLLFEIDPVDIQLSVNVAQAQLMAAQAQMDQALGSGWDLQLAQLESSVKQAQNAYSNARQQLRDYNDANDINIDDIQDKRDNIDKLRQATEKQLEEAREKLAELQANKNPGEGVGSDDWMKVQKDIANLNSKLTEYESTLSMLNNNINEMEDDDSSTHSSLRGAVRNAQIAYDSATQIYELTKDEAHNDAIKVAQANLGTATASFEAQARQLEYTKVYSPIDGVIEARNVTSQAMASQSSPAYTVSNKSTITVIFYVPADAVEQMAAGDAVTVENGRRTYEGSVTEVGAMVDQQTGLFKVKAVVDCQDGSLLTGLSVKITAPTARTEHSLLVPQSMVYYEDGAPYVYVYRDGTAVRTAVQTGISNEEMVEITSRVDPDTQIISTWHPNLTDGAKVTLKGDASEPAASSAASEAAGSAAPEQAASSEAAPSEAPSAADASSQEG